MGYVLLVCGNEGLRSFIPEVRYLASFQSSSGYPAGASEVIMMPVITTTGYGVEVIMALDVVGTKTASRGTSAVAANGQSSRRRGLRLCTLQTRRRMTVFHPA